MDWKSFINFEAILKWVTAALAKCSQEGATPAEQEAQIRNPSTRFRLKIGRKVERDAKRNGMKRAALKAHKADMVNYVIAEGKNASKAEIQALLMEAKGADPDDAEDLFDEED